MTRPLDLNFSAGATSPEVHLAAFVEIELVSGPYRVWSGTYPKAFGGETYLGVGDLGSISPVEESGDLSANGIVVELAGIDPALIGSILGDIRQGLPASAFLAVLDANQVVQGASEVFRGRVDVPSIESTGSTSTIRVTLESLLISLDRPRIRRWTDEDQKIDHPTDDGFEQVGTMARRATLIGETFSYEVVNGQVQTIRTTTLTAE